MLVRTGMMGPMWSLPPAPHARRPLGLALAGGLAVAALGACGSEPDTATDAAASASPTPAESSASESASGAGSDEAEPATEPAGTGSASPTSTTAVPVYFVADAPQGQRLFREFRSVDAGDPMAGAGALLSGGGAVDPDYTSLLPSGTLSDVRRADDAIEVVLPDDSWTTRPAGTSRAQARLAVQQLVYTLQGVEQTRDPVRAYLDGEAAAVPLLGVPTAGGVEQADPLDVLGLVNVTTPEQGTAVTGSLTASGVASSFEGTVPWEVRSGGRVVLDGFATAEGYLDRLYPWTTEVDVSGLTPGTYTFVAMTSDPSGGEGPGPTQDTKDFRVE